MLFSRRAGARAAAQQKAFEDTWEWNPEAEHACQVMMQTPGKLGEAIVALYRLLGPVPMMAYIAMMGPRLVELRKALKPTGSIYLHCDSTACHYLKILMDAVFSPINFLNEITWKRTHTHGNVGRNFGSICDTLLVYTKTNGFTWNQLYTPFSEDYIKDKFRYQDADSRLWQSVTLRNPAVRPNLRFPYKASNGVTYQPHPNGWSGDIARLKQYDREQRLHFPTKPTGNLRLKMYLDESPGTRLQNLWDDIPPINSQAQERVGFPTQKPNALLRRIIEASSNPGDVVLDPFCGCGTAVIVAELLKRQWIGIDITDVALDVIEGRLRREVGDVPYKVVAREPRALPEAVALAKSDRKHFETWALGLVGARPDQPHQGADRGVDARFLDVHGRLVEVSVKSGKVSAPHVREWRGTIERDGAIVGAFITLYQPTKPMLREAASAGAYESPTGLIPRIQILTIAQLLDPNSRRLVYPPPDAALVREPRERRKRPQDQIALPLAAMREGRAAARLPRQEVPTAAPPHHAVRRGQLGIEHVEATVPWKLAPAKAPSRRAAATSRRRRRAG